MKLDEIQDIEFLKNELKKNTVKCIKECEFIDSENNIKKSKIGEYYYYEDDDENGQYYICDCDYWTCFNYNTMSNFFEFYGQGSNSK